MIDTLTVGRLQMVLEGYSSDTYIGFIGPDGEFCPLLESAIQLGCVKIAGVEQDVVDIAVPDWEE